MFIVLHISNGKLENSLPIVITKVKLLYYFVTKDSR